MMKAHIWAPVFAMVFGALLMSCGDDDGGSETPTSTTTQTTESPAGGSTTEDPATAETTTVPPVTETTPAEPPTDATTTTVTPVTESPDDPVTPEPVAHVLTFSYHRAPGTACTLRFTPPGGSAGSSQDVGQTTADATGTASWAWESPVAAGSGEGSVDVTCGAETITFPYPV